MQKKRQKKFLIVGICCVSVGLFLLAAFWDALAFKPLLLRSVLISALGAFLLASAVTREKPRIHTTFFSIMLQFVALILFLVDAEALHLSWRKFWPILCCFSAAALLFTERLVNHRLRKSVVVPSFAIFGFGIFLSLFSFNIIKISFTQFILEFWPMIFVFAGICLIGIFVAQQQNDSTSETDAE